MEDFKRMAIFATVVERSSMSAAARQLDMSPSAVSQHIRQLEQDAGVTLLHRSTRQLTLTDAGQRFYAQCAAMCEAASRARAELAAELQLPSGELRLAGLGAGELLVTSMDGDGTKAGYDLALTRTIADAVSVPVIASGGVGTLDHLVEGVTQGHASAVLAASIFHFGQHTIHEAHAALRAAGLPARG